MTQPTQCHNTELMQKRRDGMDVSSSCFQQCLAAESVAWTSLSLSLTPSPRAAPLPSFTWAKLNRLVNRWSHSADAAIIKHLDFYLWFIFLERYISYGALVWTYVPPPLLLLCLKCASLWKVARLRGEHQILWFPASTNHQSRHLAAADAGCLAISSSFPPPAPTQA